MVLHQWYPNGGTAHGVVSVVPAWRDSISSWCGISGTRMEGQDSISSWCCRLRVKEESLEEQDINSEIVLGTYNFCPGDSSKSTHFIHSYIKIYVASSEALYTPSLCRLIAHWLPLSTLAPSGGP